jgi:hypothetical protein
MATDLWQQGVPLTLLSEAPDAQTLAGGLVNGIVPKTNMVFDSLAHRAATLIGAQAAREGMLTYLKSEKRWEWYDGSAWLYLTPGPWQPLTLASGPPLIVAFYGSPGYRVVAGGIEFRGGVKRNDGADFSVGGGAETTIASLPAAIRPSSDRAFVIAASANAMLARGTVTSAGLITVAAVPSLATTWVDLSAIRYNLG